MGCRGHFSSHVSLTGGEQAVSSTWPPLPQHPLVRGWRAWVEQRRRLDFSAAAARIAPRQEYTWQQPRRRWRSSCRLAGNFFTRLQRERFVWGAVSCMNWILELVQTPRGPPSRAVRAVCKVPRLAVPCFSSGSSGSNHSSRPQCRLYLQSTFRSACPFPSIALTLDSQAEIRATHLCCGRNKEAHGRILLEHIKSSPGQPITTGSCAATSTKRAWLFVVAPVALAEEACKLRGTWNICCVCARVS